MSEDSVARPYWVARGALLTERPFKARRYPTRMVEVRLASDYADLEYALKLAEEELTKLKEGQCQNQSAASVPVS